MAFSVLRKRRGRQLVEREVEHVPAKPKYRVTILPSNATTICRDGIDLDNLILELQRKKYPLDKLVITVEASND